MDQFPQILYRQPGIEAVHGGMYSTKIVESHDELDAAIADGWYETTPEAKEAFDAAAKGQVSGTTSTAPSGPPSRAELEQKASELGVPFSARVSDKKLADAIAEKLAAK